MVTSDIIYIFLKGLRLRLSSTAFCSEEYLNLSEQSVPLGANGRDCITISQKGRKNVKKNFEFLKDWTFLRSISVIRPKKIKPKKGCRVTARAHFCQLGHTKKETLKILIFTNLWTFRPLIFGYIFSELWLSVMKSNPTTRPEKNTE